MDFRIADTFTDSLARLTGDEQKVRRQHLICNLIPASPGMSYHKLDKAKDKSFWSVRVNSDVRIIVDRTKGGLLLSYVDHHDKAYAWAQRRKLETHPKTGAAQLVEIRETGRHPSLRPNGDASENEAASCCHDSGRASARIWGATRVAQRCSRSK